MGGTLLASVIGGGLLLGFIPRWQQSRAAVADMNELATPTVSITSPAPGKSEAGLVLAAEIRPWQEAAIYARANGYLKSWVVDIGAHVQAGQLLAEIETPDLDQQLVQAQAQLNLARANLHLAETTDARWQQLLKSGTVAQQEAADKAAAREAAVASLDAERANVRRLQELVGFRRVVAPFAGTISQRAVDVGDLVVAGSGGHELFHIAQADKLRVYVRVPEPYALGIAAGQTGTLTTRANPGQTFTAKVTTTSEAISTLSRTLLAQLEVDNSQHQILPYSFGEVSLKDNKTDPSLTLPSNTLLFRAQGLQVAVVRPDQSVELRSVQVGRDFGQSIEILGGVTAADRVVLNPSDSLVNGIKVRLAGPVDSLAAE
ncbi:MAG: Efflux transporter, family, subunit [Verrucomicrobia bacterium]|nr:Efflux transporter, family, subunit [Verrucomicrobiota bacterium]